eukprot:5704090-Prymnesium_polylepis.1
MGRLMGQLGGLWSIGGQVDASGHPQAAQGATPAHRPRAHRRRRGSTQCRGNYSHFLNKRY